MFAFIYTTFGLRMECKCLGQSVHGVWREILSPATRRMIDALYFRFLESGGVFKLAFGPKAFVVVSDPVVVRHLLKASLGKANAGAC